MSTQLSQPSSALRLISTLLVSVIFLSACQTFDPYTGEQKTSGAVKYGAIGAAVCGIIGATSSSKRARNAALGCGLIGASVGAYMDSQEKKLRSSLQNTGVGVKREGDQIRLIMPGNITFATDRARVQPEFYPVLDSVVKVLKEFDKTIVEVEGYTDSTGSWQHNMTLSEQRASEVAHYFENAGVLKQRLLIHGKGQANPLASNATAEGRARNRRVEIRLRAIESQG